MRGPGSSAGRGLLRHFLARERASAGWRFWVLWVLATNAGFFPGVALGQRLAAHAAEPLASGIVGLVFGSLTGAAQAWVLGRHIGPSPGWAGGTAAGWALGAALGAALLTQLAPGVAPGGAAWTISIALLAGAIVGVPQRGVLLRADPALARAWIPISALAWGVLFPGIVSGLFLARRLTRRG